MFVEGAFDYDQDAERTALDWPPQLCPQPEPEGVRGAAQDDGDIVILPEAEDVSFEGKGLCVEATVQAADAEGQPGSDLPAVVEATQEGLLSPKRPRRIAVSEPHRAVSRSRGPLLMVGTAVTVALSGGFVGEAFGWRLPFEWSPPALQVSALFRSLMPTGAIFGASAPPPASVTAGAEQTRSEQRGSDVAGPPSPSSAVTPLAAPPMADTNASSVSPAAAPSPGSATIDQPVASAAHEASAATEPSVAPIPDAPRVPALRLFPPSSSSRSGRGPAPSLLAPRVLGPAWFDHERPLHGFVWSPAGNGFVPTATLALPGMASSENPALSSR